MRNKKEEISIGIPGASSIMVVFAVLCMAVFAVLALSTALADERLSEASKDSIVAYYEADAAAEEKLAELRTENINGTERFGVNITDKRRLEVEVNLSGNNYDILRWQSVYSDDWEADETLDLWQGN